MEYRNHKKTSTKLYSREWKEVGKIEEVDRNQGKEINSMIGDLVKEAKMSLATKILLMLLPAFTKTTPKHHLKETNPIQVFIQIMGVMDKLIHSNSS